MTRAPTKPGTNLLVFGKTGQVATELQRQAEVIALGREEADLAHPERCATWIRHYAPRAVINAAAYTAVDRAETEEPLAQTINAAAPAAMAQACAALEIPFLHISTDYVFDGTGDTAWQPHDQPAPCNAYGRSKLAGEHAILASGVRHVILRTSWVFSAHGSNFVKTMLRLSTTRDRLDVVADQWGGPTPAQAIAAALLVMARALADGHPGGIYHFAGQPVTSWAGFARETFAQAGRDVHVTGIPTKAYPTPAARPLNSRLDSATLETDFGITPPDWRDGLRRVLTELGAA